MSATSYDPRITAYFGDAVLRAGFMPVPHLFMRHYRQLGLTTTQAMFVLQLMEITWDIGAGPRTVGDLARRMGVDGRTIRKYSEEVAKLELIRLYDQFDAKGAQIENGYDLSPLFQRLARLAPEPAPKDTFRKERTRPSANPEAVAAIPSTPGTHDPPPRIKSSALPPDQIVRPPSDHLIHPEPDQAIRVGRNERSRLNKEPKRTKKQQEDMLDDGCTANERRVVTTQPLPPEASSGHSLRWGSALTAADVAVSDQILQLIGVENPLRALIAPSLAPTEVWALLVYARAKGWNTAMLISKVYDKHTRQPRPAGELQSEHDTVGRLLAELDSTIALILVQLIGENCPATPNAVLTHAIVTASEVARATADATWAVMATLRGVPSSKLIVPMMSVPTTTHLPSPDSALTKLWQAAQHDLAAELGTSEWETWIKPVHLLELTDGKAIVGVPNIFVRQEVEGRFLALLDDVLTTQVGYAVQVEIVVQRYMAQAPTKRSH